MSRETVYAALFSLIANDLGVLATVKTRSRTTKHFDDVPAEACPALYLLQTGEDWIRPGKGVPPKRTLDAKLLLYTVLDNSTGLQSTTVNNVLDAIDSALTATNPGGAVTLGGLAEHVYVDGRIIIDEGLLQSKSVTVVPIRILLP